MRKSLLPLLLLWACAAPRPEDRPGVPIDPAPVDPAIVASSDETLTWGCRRQAEADLDGDGDAERVIVTADVTLAADGAPAWEDGHRWAAFVEDGRARTLLYGGFVPNGFVEAAVAAPLPGRGRALLVVERTPQRLRVLEIGYAGPGEAGLVRSATFPLDAWVPGFAQLP